MSSPDIVALDTRSASDKASFLAAAARDLGFPAYFGGNWDAFEECARDFGEERKPVLVVWSGASNLPAGVRETAVQILDAAFPPGADVLIVDGVDDSPQPDFAVSMERIAIPTGGLGAAQAFWTTVGFHVDATVCEADAIAIRLVEVDEFNPSVGPEIAVSALLPLVQRLTQAGYPLTENPQGIDVSDPHGTLITFTAY